MGAETMQLLTLEQAVRRYEQIALPLRPATLHPGYVAADAERNPLLQPAYLSYENQGECWLNCFHLTDVPDTQWKDASSPYGYAGPVCSSDAPEFVAAAWRAYLAWMRGQKVVVEYVRFHPVLGNERHYGGRVVDNRQVVCVDLDQGDVFAACAARLRQTVKKAVAAGLVYEETSLASCVREFAAYHRAAMREMQTDPFFLFDDGYFHRLASTGLAKLGVCRFGGSTGSDWLAASLFLDGVAVREYHLAATNEQGRKVGASSFVLHEAALAARRQGMRKLYLGGGSDTSSDNPLLFFKAAFSPQRLTYRTGWTVFNDSAYDDLKKRFADHWGAYPDRPIFYRKV